MAFGSGLASGLFCRRSAVYRPVPTGHHELLVVDNRYAHPMRGQAGVLRFQKQIRELVV